MEAYQLRPQVQGAGSKAVLRVVTLHSGQVRYVACIPAPQVRTWAWVWSEGWALVTEPEAVAMIVQAMRS